MNHFNNKFRIKDLFITQIGGWIISLRPKQVTIGSLVLSLSRKCSHLGEITKKEGGELASAFKEAERILKKVFHPDKVNYLALMMVDEQVHFHIIPRYRNKVLFAENLYEDRSWPHPPDLKSIDLNEDELKAIKVLLLKSV